MTDHFLSFGRGQQKRRAYRERAFERQKAPESRSGKRCWCRGELGRAWGHHARWVERSVELEKGRSGAAWGLACQR